MKIPSPAAIAVAFSLTLHCANAEPIDGVVLVIADGTSTELLTAARIFEYGAEGNLALERMPHTALVRTFSENDVVTDSSAAATAMARGRKTPNQFVGITKPQEPSILDLAKKAGWSTAVITDDEITGGTPSPFLVEEQKRTEAWLIAEKLVPQLGSRVDIAAGGGAAWFAVDGDEEYPPPVRETIQRTSEALAASSARRVGTWPEFHSLASGPDAASTAPVLATLWPGVFPYIADRERTPRLVELTEQTVKLLRARGKPFLLVVEAALPDKAAHSNRALRAIREVLEFDATMAWLMENLTPNTLLLATTDHGTGGLALNGYMPLKTRGNAILGKNPLSGNSVLTWASGPGGDPEANRYSSTDIADHRPETTSVERIPTDPEYAQPALTKRASAYHTGGDVWLLGSGPGSEKVHGFLDNTEIYRIMKEAIGE